MKKKELIFMVFLVLILGVAVGTTFIIDGPKVATTDGSEEQQNVIPQLTTEDREDASTMVLLGAPPMQPADHIDRWNPELRTESCMTCHSNSETGAPRPPVNHYYEDNLNKPIFRDNCVQCHGEQNETNTAFNSKE